MFTSRKTHAIETAQVERTLDDADLALVVGGAAIAIPSLIKSRRSFGTAAADDQPTETLAFAYER